MTIMVEDKTGVVASALKKCSHNKYDPNCDDKKGKLFRLETNPLLTFMMYRKNVEAIEQSMTDSTRRRRRVRAGSKPEILKPSLPVEEKSEGSTSENLSERQVALDLPSQTELTEEVEKWVGQKEIVGMKTGLDEIGAELKEEGYSALVESDYWDETHSWGVDDEEASDEYWHFLGRYE